MPVPAQEYVFGFQVPIDDSQRVKVLEGDEDLGGEEADCREGEAVEGLAEKEVVEVSVGAVVNEEAGVVGDVDAGVERGKERVVEHGEDLGLGADVAELLGCEGVLVDNLEGEGGGVRVVAVVVAEAAEEDTAEVAGAEVAEELEVAEVESAVGGEGGGGFDGGPVGVPLAVVEGGSCGGWRGGGGGGGEAGLVEAEGEAAAG